MVRRLRPGDERRHGLPRAIAIVDLERETLCLHVGLHGFQRFRGLAHQHAFRRVIARHLAASEVVGACIAHVLLDAWIHIAEIDEVLRHLTGACWDRRERRKEQGEEGCAHADYSASTRSSLTAVSEYFQPG